MCPLLPDYTRVPPCSLRGAQGHTSAIRRCGGGLRGGDLTPRPVPPAPPAFTWVGVGRRRGVSHHLPRSPFLRGPPRVGRSGRRDPSWQRPSRRVTARLRGARRCRGERCGAQRTGAGSALPREIQLLRISMIITTTTRINTMAPPPMNMAFSFLSVGVGCRSPALRADSALGWGSVSGRIGTV